MAGAVRRAMARFAREVRSLPDRQATLLPLGEQGVIDRIFEAVSDDPDIEWLAIDATVIRAQAQAAGARIKKGALKPRLSGDPEAGSAPRSTP